MAGFDREAKSPFAQMQPVVAQAVVDGHGIMVAESAQRGTACLGGTQEIVVQQSLVVQKHQDPLGLLRTVAQGAQILLCQVPVRSGAGHFPDPAGQYPELGCGQGAAGWIAQLAGQQKEAPLLGRQRKRLLGGVGALTISSVRLPSAPRIMGLMV